MSWHSREERHGFIPWKTVCHLSLIRNDCKQISYRHWPHIELIKNHVLIDRLILSLCCCISSPQPPHPCVLPRTMLHASTWHEDGCQRHIAIAGGLAQGLWGSGLCSQLATGPACLGVKVKRSVPPGPVAFSVQMALVYFPLLSKAVKSIRMEGIRASDSTYLPWHLKKF